ncbi:MAG: hypothetical protein RL092_787 [Bacteroidota bacterium]|jgi:hypothetical protein
MKRTYLLFSILVITTFSCNRCKEETKVEPKLIVKIVTNPNQERLNNLGQPAAVPAGHAAQSPTFHKISAHYLEFAPNMYTALGGGEVVYHAPETMAGGSNAIDFSLSKVVAPGEVFFEMPLKNFTPGTYEYVRASLLYQNYDINLFAAGFDLVGRVASFVGFNTYITNYTINTQTQAVNDDVLQGYWGFETSVFGIPYITSGQAPAGATTVPNPIFATSPIPQGSCVVTGAFTQPLVITGNETQDIVVTLSLSTNNSFEWVDSTPDGKWQPEVNEQVVDMGLRGLIPSWQ